MKAWRAGRFLSEPGRGAAVVARVSARSDVGCMARDVHSGLVPPEVIVPAEGFGVLRDVIVEEG